MARRSRQIKQTEQLISEVKKYPCLYAIDKPEYKNPDLKTTCWTEISENLNRDTSMLRRDWKNLRDGYRQALITRRGTRKRSTRLKPWKYERQMIFVKPYIGPKSCPLDTNPAATTSTTVSDGAVIDVENDDKSICSKIETDTTAATTSTTVSDDAVIDVENDNKSICSKIETNTTAATTAAAVVTNTAAYSTILPCFSSLGIKSEPVDNPVLSPPVRPSSGPRMGVESFLNIHSHLPNEFIRARPVNELPESAKLFRFTPRRLRQSPTPEETRPQRTSCYFRQSRSPRSVQWDEPNANDLELFFISMFHTSKKMPRNYQNKIKMEVLATVLRVEEDYELSRRNSFGLFPAQANRDREYPPVIIL
ncbi:MADF domain-containing protein [Nephila pilipes]|uniref:MADF domain-containing protein n=1 Tax=Nephila pilipes TaxID=299642 RepID=A0A8X6TLB0_NEPPI|nr:MADF domain-containing protein [Nephila pilipes]